MSHRPRLETLRQETAAAFQQAVDLKARWAQLETDQHAVYRVRTRLRLHSLILRSASSRKCSSRACTGRPSSRSASRTRSPDPSSTARSTTRTPSCASIASYGASGTSARSGPRRGRRIACGGNDAASLADVGRHAFSRAVHAGGPLPVPLAGAWLVDLVPVRYRMSIVAKRSVLHWPAFRISPDVLRACPPRIAHIDPRARSCRSIQLGIAAMSTSSVPKRATREPTAHEQVRRTRNIAPECTAVPLPCGLENRLIASSSRLIGGAVPPGQAVRAVLESTDGRVFLHLRGRRRSVRLR